MKLIVEVYNLSIVIYIVTQWCSIVINSVECQCTNVPTVVIILVCR